MSILTITTDFGLIDGYVGVMKGVIWGIAPSVNIVDITHNIPSQNVMQGAISLMSVTPYFPAGSVHVAVIDPGVGTRRRALAAQIGSQYYVLPDNGLLTYLLISAKKKKEKIEIVDTNRPEFWLDEISNVFHGRDIFAPIGAHLSNGRKLKELGIPINDPVLIELPKVKIDDKGISGEVISVDALGNVTTNISGDHLKLLGENIFIKINNVTINRINKPIAERSKDEIIGILGRQDELIIIFKNKVNFLKSGINVGDHVVITKGIQ